MNGGDSRALLKVARDAIAAHLTGGGRPGADPAAAASAEDEGARGVFVTLWSQAPEGRRLRGCIGRFGREFEALSDDVASCAVLAAVEDPRFPPVSAAELSGLAIEISLLGAREKIEDGSQLDPHRYGVIMTSRVTGRHATLLPNIDGIETVERQLKCVREKAGIGAAEPVELQRYEVRKVSE